MCCAHYNTDVGKMIESFAGAPVQGMAAIPVMFLVKEFYDTFICVKSPRFTLTGDQFNLRLILTVSINPYAETLSDETAH